MDDITYFGDIENSDRTMKMTKHSCIIKKEDRTCRVKLFLLAVIMLCAVLFCGCGSGAAGNGNGAADATGLESRHGQLKIVTTIFPIYDWTREILGENPAGAELVMLLDAGVDMHSFQPTAKDILDIATCDLFLYVGGESDEWVEDALKENENPDRVALNLLDVLGAYALEEEIAEGMQVEEDEALEFDEHIWLSFINANVLSSAIADALATIDPDNVAVYEENFNDYAVRLDALESAYEAMVMAAPKDVVLFGDRFPFRYLMDEYAIRYYAAFPGCEAETEASFATITFLAEKIDELDLHCILTIDGGEGKVAETILQNTRDKNQTILTLNSMQSVTAADVEAGVTYLQLMENNLLVLKDALQ